MECSIILDDFMKKIGCETNPISIDMQHTAILTSERGSARALEYAFARRPIEQRAHNAGSRIMVVRRGAAKGMKYFDAIKLLFAMPFTM